MIPLDFVTCPLGIRWVWNECVGSSMVDSRGIKVRLPYNTLEAQFQFYSTL